MRGAWMPAMVVGGLLVSGSGTVAFADAAALLAAEERAITRISIATRQRYYVQKIAKSACYALTRHHPEENANRAWLNLASFEERMDLLELGDPTQDITPETDPTVLAAIAQTKKNWRIYSAATRQLVSGDWHSVPMSQVLALQSTVLAEINGAVDEIVSVHSEHLQTRKAYSATINIAEQQRMLVEKAAKEVCFVALNMQADLMRAGLAQTIETFDTYLFALENGDFDLSVIDPPSLAVLRKISEIRTLWETYRAPLERVANGAEPSFEEVAFVESNNGPLFELSDALVQLYLKK